MPFACLPPVQPVSSAAEEDDPLEDNAALAPEGLGECAGAEASLSPGQWTPLSGQSRATGSGPPSPPRSGSADSGRSSAAASLSSGSAPNVDDQASVELRRPVSPAMVYPWVMKQQWESNQWIKNDYIKSKILPIKYANRYANQYNVCF